MSNSVGEDRRKHLELIQRVINRLAVASFQIKGWTVTIVTALLGVIVAAKLDSRVGFVASIPVVIFWFLDGYYLRQERLYRDLYNASAGLPVKGNKVAQPTVYSMDAELYKNLPGNWCGPFFSWTVLPMHVVLLLIVIVFSLLSVYTEFLPPDTPKVTPPSQVGPPDPTKKPGE